MFQAFGVRVDLHLTFFLLLGALTVMAWVASGAQAGFFTLLTLLCIFSCVLLHEFGHCLTAQYFGIRVPRILLLPIGGMAQFEEIPRDPRKELLITIMGPMVNFVLAGLLFLIFGFPGSMEAVTGMVPEANLGQLLGLVNLMMGLFNLLPVFPMDGGRIFRALMAYRFSYLNATRAAVFTGKVLALVGIFVALWSFQNLLVAALFAFIFVGGDIEYRIVKRREIFSGLQVGDLMSGHYATIAMECSLSEAAAAFKEQGVSDLLILNPGGYIIGILPHSAMQPRAEQAVQPGASVMTRILPITRMLQADWPLEIVGDNILFGSKGVFPVYSGNRLIGVLDNRKIRPDDLLRASKRKRRTVNQGAS